MLKTSLTTNILSQKLIIKDNKALNKKFSKFKNLIILNANAKQVFIKLK